MIVDSEGSVAAAAKVPCSANDDSSSFVLDDSLVADNVDSVAAAAKVLCGAKKDSSSYVSFDFEPGALNQIFSNMSVSAKTAAFNLLSTNSSFARTCIPLNLKESATSARVETLKRMWDASFFKIDWPDTHLCADIIEQMLSNMNDRERSAVLRRVSLQQAPASTGSRKRCAAKLVGSTAAKQKRTGTNSALQLKAWYQAKHNQQPAGGVLTQPVPSDCRGTSGSSVKRPTCLECKKEISSGERRPYTHKRQNGSFYLIFRCCGKEFSNLASLSGEKNKQFSDLKPVHSDLAEWRFEEKRWRLKCRGQNWTRCDHCQALYKYAPGARNYRTKEKCRWSQLPVAAAGIAAKNILDSTT